MALIPCAPMFLDDFDYELPDALIARHPAAKRRDSRLLEVGASVVDRSFAELPKLLKPGDLLVFNDTRVIPARLAATKQTGGRAEIMIERVTGELTALAQVRASKTPKAGSKLFVDDIEVVVEGRVGEMFELHVASDVMSVLNEHGSVPLPPYIDREPEADDSERYQTVYARQPGAVAAPTAGLHFDDAMLGETQAMGVDHAWVTLHVGAGTFLPLRKEHIEENRLHRERVEVSADCVDKVLGTRSRGGRVIAVGTTAVRSLECASRGGTIEAFHGETDLFILPGYEFRSTDAMITNFHLPKSSLLMLVAAFAGRERILDAYRHAVESQYRFFSYGDSMFLTPQ